MNASDILQIWRDLALEEQEGSTMIRRRVEPDAKIDLFASYSVAERQPGLLVEGLAEAGHGRNKWPACHGLRIISDVKAQEKGFRSVLWIVLEDDALRDIFSVLCTDLIFAMAREPDADAALALGLRRLSRWHVLFDRVTPNGLSREKQQGLFGELSFMLALMKTIGPERSVAAWHGWDSANQDFKLGGLGIEVKTSSAKRHTRIFIANEKQLDESSWKRLILTLVKIEINVAGGLTLPVIVGVVRDSLKEYPGARSDFNIRLLETGYSDDQAHLYSDVSFLGKSIGHFEIRDQFPRLTEKNLPTGVGDVTYSILASDLEEFEISADHIEGLIKGMIGE